MSAMRKYSFMLLGIFILRILFTVVYDNSSVLLKHHVPSETAHVATKHQSIVKQISSFPPRVRMQAVNNDKTDLSLKVYCTELPDFYFSLKGMEKEDYAIHTYNVYRVIPCGNAAIHILNCILLV